jgi:hypothetical protein
MMRRLHIFSTGTFLCSSFGHEMAQAQLHDSDPYGVGILEGVYLPRCGIEWMLAAIGTTAFLAGFWIRARWES